MRRRWSFAAILVAACSLLSFALLPAGCRSRGEGERTIALITPLTTTEGWKSVHAGVVRAAEDDGFRWYWNAPTHENDPERQLELLRRQLELRVAGVVLVPAHSSVLIGAVGQAHRSGVPLVIAGERLAVPLDAETGSVSTDDRKAGMMAGALTARLLHGRGSVAVVGLDRASTEVLDRVRSFEETIHGAGATRVVLKLDAAVGPGGQSQSDLLRLLRANRGARLVFSASPAATRAVYGTLSEAGLLGRILLIGCGQDPELYPALRSGKIQALVAENAYRIGFASAAMLLAAQKRHAPLEHLVLDPLLLTGANLDQPDTRRYLHPYTGFDR